MIRGQWPKTNFKNGWMTTGWILTGCWQVVEGHVDAWGGVFADFDGAEDIAHFFWAMISINEINGFTLISSNFGFLTGLTRLTGFNSPSFGTAKHSTPIIEVGMRGGWPKGPKR